MGWWTERVVPHLVDRSLDAEEIRRVRRQACAGLTGRVIEVGFGSGLNVAHYPPAVSEVAAVEPSDVAWRLAGRRVSSSGPPVSRAGVDGQRLAAHDGSYDAALSTFTLCVVPDPASALRELRRVLAPAGRLHFAEHGRSPDEPVARWQDRLTPAQRRVFGGCHLDRPIADLVGADFEILDLDERYLPGPRASRPFGFLSIGTAAART
ncbi:MAG TPA: class I SAM-dependent methyltransferase [Nocardioidaceae bacterium]|nr:class I SAM-dependent methyltransferase [Nocardioidaceae bacterium]